MLTMNIIITKTPKKIGTTIAGNLRTLRKKGKLSMKALAELSGVSYGSLKRFESTGQISLSSLLKLAIVLDCVDDFDYLFKKTEILSIQEIINGKV